MYPIINSFEIENFLKNIIFDFLERAHQWELNGGNVGTNSSIYSNSTLVNGNYITCIMTSNATCVTGSPATSNQITMTVNSTSHGTQPFSYTGAMQTWSVPTCVTSLTLDCFGAQGGMFGGNSTESYGGEAKGTLVVIPGQTLNIFVGQNPTGYTTGGWNGGASGTRDGGGGASDVRVGGTALTNRVIVAGGGGGKGYYGNGGVGGDNIGGDGVSAYNANGGGGGTQFSGGALGLGCSGNGYAGSSGQGGNGSSDGGGGGGGYYGGGGGGWCYYSSTTYGGGGGGGSNYLGGVSAITNAQGVQSGDGKVIITW